MYLNYYLLGKINILNLIPYVYPDHGQNLLNSAESVSFTLSFIVSVHSNNINIAQSMFPSLNNNGYT